MVRYGRKEFKTVTITEGVIWKQLLIFFFPMLFGTFFQQLYNTADAVVVGRFVGKVALSAVGGTTGTLINLFVGFFIGLSSGATVIISQYYGAKQTAKLEKAVHTAVALSVAGGAFIMLIGLIGAPAALRLMGTPDEIMPYSILYIKIFFCGMIPNLIYNMGAGILRAIGDSKRPLYFLIISCFVNVILDLFFVVVLRMGVAGAAIATVLSQTLSAVMVCLTLMRTHHSYRLDLKRIRFHAKILLRIIRIGLPAGIQSTMYSFSNIIIQSSINRFGTDTIAAWTAYGKIDGLFWMTMASFGVSITTFVGQNFGALKYERVRKAVRVCLFFAASATILLSTFLYSFGGYIYRLFTADTVVLAKGMDILHFMVPAYLAYVSIEILSGALRGMGNSLLPMIITCAGVCVFRVLWIFFALPVWPVFRTAIMSYPLTWSTTSILFIIYYQVYVRKKRIC